MPQEEILANLTYKLKETNIPTNTQKLMGQN